MAKKKHAQERARQSHTRPQPAPPSPRSEPASPEESERFQRIVEFAGVLEGHLQRGHSIVATPQGISPTWPDKVILKLKNAARGGRSVPWEITDLSTGKTAIVYFPLLGPKPPTGKPGRRFGWRRVSLEDFMRDRDQYPGSSQRDRAARLGLAERTVREYAKEAKALRAADPRPQISPAENTPRGN